MPSMIDQLCWICGDPATTGEHKTKQSDLRAVLGTPSQERPFYYHDGTTRNRLVRSYRADFLKSPSWLCAPCNNHRTQPYDRAWECLSHWLRTRRPPVTIGDVIRADRVWPQGATAQMRNVQLFFTKLTGCHLVQAGINFDQASLAKSLLTGKSNSCVYLKFRMSRTNTLVGMLDLLSDVSPGGDPCGLVVWIYSLGSLAIEIQYVNTSGRHISVPDAWHPSSGSNRFMITAPLNEREPKKGK
jgi:hypothetical protein